MPRTLLGLAFLLALVASAPDLGAQSTLSTILGTVQDPSGAAVGGAKLTLRNTDENTLLTTTSSQEGLFEFLNVQPGRYGVSVEKQGFAIASTGEIHLEARETRRADFTLEIASRTETAVVTAQVPIINTENGTISDSMDSEQIIRLPTNYRAFGNSPLSLLITVPGVQPGFGGFSIGGGLPIQSDASVDGISALGGATAPSAEAISEFRVTSAGNSAAFSQMGDITIITKSGTNQMHGSAFWYHQNRALDATTYGSPQKQHKVFNTFGGSLGGPAYIPGIYDGHNKAFFFADYEGNRKPNSALDQAPVPTLAMRQGDLSGLPGGAVVDPLNGAPFPGNRIPAARISGVANKLLSKYYPAPNVAVPLEDLNYRVLMPLNIYADGYDLRLDQVIGPRQQIFGRWSQKFSKTLGDDLFPLSGYTEFLPSQNLVLSHTYTPRPNVSNEFRFGLSLYWPKNRFPLRGKDVVANLGLQGLDLRNVGDSGGFPLFDFSDGTGFPLIEAGKDQAQQDRIFQSQNTLSWIRARHTMKFGADMRWGGNRGPILTPLYSADDFGGFVFTSGAFSGNAFADLLLGLPAQSNRSVLGPPLNLFSSSYAFFAQDNWKISQSLTLEFALRWELHPPTREQSGDITNFDHSTGAVIVPDRTIPPAPGFLAAINACSVATGPGPCTKVLSAFQVGLPESLRRTYEGDWDPRLGFAWRPWPSGKTVLRGSIGIYTLPLPDVTDVMAGIHSSDNRTFTNYQGPGVPPLFTFPNVYPGPSALGEIGVESFFSGIDPTLKDARSYQWNFTVERELPWATALRASYIGIQSSGLPERADFNQLPVGQLGASPPFPIWKALVSMENLGFASYEGLRTDLTRRLKNGLFFQASYVFSKNIGDAGALGLRFVGFPGTENAGVTDRFNTRYDRGTLLPSRQQRFLLTGLFPLPFGRGRALGSNWRGLREGLFGGWELSTVTMVQSGPYQTPRVNFFGGPRPDRIGNGNLANPTRDHYYDKSAFVPVPRGAERLGNAGVGILEGPGTVAISAGLAKTFRVTEKLRLRLESTFTNLPNHPNFAAPNAIINSPQFGKLTSVQSGENAGNRTGQVAARLDF